MNRFEDVVEEEDGDGDGDDDEEMVVSLRSMKWTVLMMTEFNFVEMDGFADD